MKKLKYLKNFSWHSLASEFMKIHWAVFELLHAYRQCRCNRQHSGLWTCKKSPRASVTLSCGSWVYLMDEFQIIQILVSIILTHPHTRQLWKWSGGAKLSVLWHFDPQRRDHYVVSECWEPFIQWCSVISQKNRYLNF